MNDEPADLAQMVKAVPEYESTLPAIAAGEPLDSAHRFRLATLGMETLRAALPLPSEHDLKSLTSRRKRVRSGSPRSSPSPEQDLPHRPR